jgi:hypothetical protein
MENNISQIQWQQYDHQTLTCIIFPISTLHYILLASTIIFISSAALFMKIKTADEDYAVIF